MKNLNKQIAISIIKGQLEKGNIPNSIEIAKRNGISARKFGEITKELHNKNIRG